MANSVPIEIEIRTLLLKKRTAREILAELLPRLYDGNTNYFDRRAIFSFAWNSGIHLPAIEQVPELLRMNQLVPWAWLSEFYARTRLAPDNDVTEAVVKGARTQEQIPDLLVSRAWDKFIPALVELRREVQRIREEKRRSQRQNLLDKLAFYRNEQLAEEEKRLLQLLDKMYPEDPQIKELGVDFNERWARHVISRHISSDQKIYEATETHVTLIDATVLEPIFKEWKAISLKRPELIYEFTVALLAMDMELMALEILGSEKLDFATDWLKAEVLLRSRRYIECLDHLVSLESRYGSDPETAFAVTYLRAQALWGLRQQGRALELIQTLLNVRPNYRSAASLLKDWSVA